MTVRLRRVPTKCVRKLSAGEAKRVPRDLTRLSGYHIGCPGCSRPQAISIASTPILEEEGPGDGPPIVTIDPVVCDRCGVRFRVVRDEVVILGP